MYNLYRAWFGDGITGDSYPRLQETLSPPDTVVRVGNEGEHQFVAHKVVLAAHSGYLKALLTTANATSNSNVGSNFGSCGNSPATAIAVTTTNFSGQSTRQPVTSVSVSSIGGEAFAPLLNYMYTGRLEVTLDNVYSVLLATHLLHMPGALEQCRAALLRLRVPAPLPTPIPVPTSTSGTGNILRPIPNRLMVAPSMCWPPPTPLYPPTAAVSASVGIPHLPQLQPSMLMQSTVPASISVVPTTGIHEAQSSTSTHYSVVDVPSPKCSPSQSTSPTPSSTSRSSSPLRRGKKSTSTERRKEERERTSLNSGPTKHRPRLQHGTSTEDKTSTRNRDSSAENLPIADNDRGRSSRRRTRGGSSGGNESSSSGVLSVVYDIAYCDGPVKFHRVLNENYSSATCDSSPIAGQPRLQRPCLEVDSGSSENDENGGPGGTKGTCDPVETDADATNDTGSYTCGYCRHTFKSQYCYRKHTKRHLLPTGVNDSASNKLRQDVARRKEVRLLDLNVQYYPCKICGCKFPSYYFVHKHRKLWHANADERQPRSDATNSTTAQDPESTSSTIHESH